MRSRFAPLPLAVFFLGFLLLSSCGGESETSRPPLRFWHFWSEPGQKRALADIVKAFEEKHGCTVELTELTWNDGKEKLQLAFNSGAPPDVIELGSDWVPQFAAGGVLDKLPTQQTDLGRFLPMSVSAGMWNGLAYAWPWTVDTRVLYVNKGLVASSGWEGSLATYDDLLAAARAVQGTGAYGFAANGADAHRLYKKILPMIWSYGGDVVDAQGRPTFARPENVAALSRYAELARTGVIETQRQLDAAFLQGRVAFWPSGSWLLTKLEKAQNLDWEAVVMPGTKAGAGMSFAGGEYLAISASCQQKVLAREFLRYMTSAETAVTFCSAVDEAGFPADTAGLRHEQLTKRRGKATFARQLASSRMTPVHPKWLELEAILEDAVAKVLLGEARPEDALAAAQNEAVRLLE